jgi:hypothetical protein
MLSLAERLNASDRLAQLRRTQYEHMFSALPSNPDIARRSWHVPNGPTADAASSITDKEHALKPPDKTTSVMRAHGGFSLRCVGTRLCDLAILN